MTDEEILEAAEADADSTMRDDLGVGTDEQAIWKDGVEHGFRYGAKWAQDQLAKLKDKTAMEFVESAAEDYAKKVEPNAAALYTAYILGAETYAANTKSKKVRLPKKKLIHTDESSPTNRRNTGFNDALDDVALALKEQGLEIEE